MDEETPYGWRAFKVTSVQPDGYVVNLSLYERFMQPAAGDQTGVWPGMQRRAA
jgi:hypothetical protein